MAMNLHIHLEVKVNSNWFSLELWSALLIGRMSLAKLKLQPSIS